MVEILTSRLDVSREDIDKLRMLVSLVIAANASQNLIAKPTELEIWDRHVLDSAQLLGLAQRDARTWLDVGTGAGFPGLVLAIMTRSDHMLIEPRKRRAEFLMRAAEALCLADRVQVVVSPVERFMHAPFDFITARAVSSLTNILHITQHLANLSTVWLLHKGRSARVEVDAAASAWTANVELLASMTDAQAAIVRVSAFTGAPKA